MEERTSSGRGTESVGHNEGGFDPNCNGKCFVVLLRGQTQLMCVLTTTPAAAALKSRIRFTSPGTHDSKPHIINVRMGPRGAASASAGGRDRPEA